MDLNNVTDEQSIQDLLAQQLTLVQQVLEFNKEITRRLGKDEMSMSHGLSTTGSIPVREAPPVSQKSAISNEGEAPQSNHDDFAAFPAGSVMMALESVFGNPRSLEEPMLPKSPQQSHAQPQKHDTEAPKGMFPNVEDVKARVVKALNKPEYNVEDFYKSTGFCQGIAKNACFKNFTLVVIAVNTVWIAIETDQNKKEVLSEAPLLYQIVDNLFCIFFTLEIAVRFFSFRVKMDSVRHAQFMFDLFLVVLMVWETWIAVFLFYVLGGAMDVNSSATSVLRVFRLFRLARVARVARLLRNFPELMILVKGMLMAMRSVSATLMLLIIIIYVFAIMFTQLLWNHPAGKGCFETVPMAMHCLLMSGVFSDQEQFINKLLSASVFYYVFVLFYMVLGSLTVMNMLIGVICEVVSVVAQGESDELLTKELKEKVLGIQAAIKDEGSDMVSEENFEHLMHNQDALQSLDDVGVDVVALVEFADFIFRDKKELPLSEFIATVLQFRGSNNATVKDIVDMRKFVSRELHSLQTTILDKRNFEQNRVATNSSLHVRS